MTTVKDLIERLQKEDPNTPIVTAYHNGAVIGIDINKIQCTEVRSDDTGCTYRLRTENKHWRGKTQTVLIIYDERD